MTPVHQQPWPPLQVVHHILPDSQIITIQHIFLVCIPSGRCTDMSDCAPSTTGPF